MVASNDQELFRALKLNAKIAELLIEGSRDPKEVADILQIIKDGKRFRSANSVSETPLADVSRQLASWQSRYLGIGIKKDFSKLHIPERPDGFTRLIVGVKEPKISELITELKKKMNFWIYTDLKNLDKVKDIVQRPEGDYAIWVRDRQ